MIQIGAYRVERELGRGGMGVVYLARDTRLDRLVAIKAVPEQFVADPDRLARFEREAKIVASLHHPGIAVVFALEELDGKRFLIMEYVEGETLANRLRRGPLPIDEAQDLSRQVAEALEAAHEKGVIHRDLKPGNIMVTPDGRAKILDFGLARSGDGSPSSSGAPCGADSPTATSPPAINSPTIPGAVMGTAGYMSPEQARGKPVDKRSDIFSFGCVLYEMFAGSQPFRGETVADSLGATMHKELDLSHLPAGTPSGVRRVLQRCLAKEKRNRLHDIADARIELQSVDLEGEGRSAGAPKGMRKMAAVLTFVAGAALTAGAAWLLNRSAAPVPRPVTRFTLSGLGIPADAFQSPALSPDGRRLAYRAIGDDGRERIHVRSFDSLEIKKLAEEVLGGWYPFFSPDSERVGFYALGQLKHVTLSTGMTKTIALIDRGGFSGATWLSDDRIIFAGTGRQFGRVRASGGEVEFLEINGLPEGQFVISPWALPDGEALLCGVSDGSAFHIGVYEFTGRTLTVIAENGFNPMYVSTGHILYQQSQSTNELMALPFDARKRRATGESFAVLRDLGRRESYQARMFTAATDGTLAYIRRSAKLEQGALTAVDRQGKSSLIVELDKVVDLPRISPDGRRIAFRVAAPNCDIWVHDIERGTTTRLTREGDNHGIAWFGDGTRIAFARLGAPALWSIMASAADGAGEVEQLSKPAITRGYASSVSPDGHFVLVGSGTNAGEDVYLVDTRDKTAKPLLHSRFAERSAVFSPDGRYLAYDCDESGSSEVYVQPFPSLGAREQVSTAGGEQPVWSRDGKELFYRLDRKMMAVEVKLQPTFSAGRPRVLFESALSPKSNTGLQTYDVSPDGQRFVMVRSRSAEGGAEVNVVLNWFEELRALSAKAAK